MPDRPGGSADVIGLNQALIRLVLDEHERASLPRLDECWTYFRNPSGPVGLAGSASHRRTQAQERGLPPRLTGSAPDLTLDDRLRPRREIVVENDIAWRVHTMVDFMFGRSLRVTSTAASESLRADVERTLDAVLEASGGVALLQDIALLGNVFGHVDLALRIDEDLLSQGAFNDPAELAAQAIRVEPVDPRRGVPLLSPDDYRTLDAYLIHYGRRLSAVAPERDDRLDRAARLFGRRPAERAPSFQTDTVTEVFHQGRWARLIDGRVAETRESTLLPGTLPIVHIQNLAQPFRFHGISEVEQLIPLQDELNTRLSDRATRVTMQSFKMYLAKGLDGFDKVPVGPGAIWSTDNNDASIEAFGGDGQSPSEDRHIEDVREALDKISGVPPLAGGVIRARVGNLSSATALRVTLMSLIAKTERKRVTYGRGIAQVCRMILEALDAAGVLRTEPAERGGLLVWPEVVPTEQAQELAAARTKLDVGVPAREVLGKLGYVPARDDGIV
jgi:hypothetical protein